jgi:hypothetical protein
MDGSQAALTLIVRQTFRQAQDFHLRDIQP